MEAIDGIEAMETMKEYFIKNPKKIKENIKNKTEKGEQAKMTH